MPARAVIPLPLSQPEPRRQLSHCKQACQLRPLDEEVDHLFPGRRPLTPEQAVLLRSYGSKYSVTNHKHAEQFFEPTGHDWDPTNLAALLNPD